MQGQPTAEDIEGWADELERVGRKIARRFTRAEPRRRATAYIRGLLSVVPRKNSWQIAEHLGDDAPHAVQHLLGRAEWDADLVRDDLIAYVADRLADARGVLIVDETGFLKKGDKSAGVQRQYSGTAGRIENCQVGVLLAFAGARGMALVDRELYLPESWAGDDARRRGAGIPEEATFATKPRLAERMLERAWRLGLKAAWVTADSVYGDDAAFRRFLDRRKRPFVLAVRSSTMLFDGTHRRRVDGIAADLPASSWVRSSAGDGSKGPRMYDWALMPAGEVDARGWRLWLLVRRHCERRDELAYYLCRGPAGTSREELIRVAGARWAVEECIERAKGCCGLADYEVRSWTGWHRHVTLSLWALAVLSAIRSRASASSPSGTGGPAASEKGGAG